MESTQESNSHELQSLVYDSSVTVMFYNHRVHMLMPRAAFMSCSKVIMDQTKPVVQVDQCHTFLSLHFAPLNQL